MRVCAGVYRYTFGELVFTISRIRDGDPGSYVNGKWVYSGGEGDGEGGHDHFYTKAEALAALREYVDHRQYVPRIGWCYVPAEQVEQAEQVEP